MKTQIIKNCQVCNSSDLEEIISLGYLPHPNVMQSVGSRLEEAIYIPHELLKCNKCSLVQFGCIVDPETVFPPDYAYVSRTTKILKDNFTQLSEEVSKLINLQKEDLVVDIGSNDGTLLSNFKLKCRIYGIEPTNAAKYANEHNIPTTQKFFNFETVKEVINTVGQAKVITACNVFAHMPDPNSLVEDIKLLLKNNGIFINENHYLVSLMKTNQFDTIYSEHLRYYSLTSLKYLFEAHEMEIFDVKLIPTHGGSIRVYTAKKGTRNISSNVQIILDQEKEYLTYQSFYHFQKEVVQSKINLYRFLQPMKSLYGIGAPSRSITLLNYIGLNEDIIAFILETPESNKIGKFAPGTKIKIIEETQEILQRVGDLIILSWHISDELIPKIRLKGFKGRFIIPLPYPHISEN